MPANLVTCYCRQCGTKFFNEDGRRISGQRVSRDTRARHEKEDHLREMQMEAKASADNYDADDSDVDYESETESRKKTKGVVKAAEERCKTEMGLITYMCSMLAAWLNLVSGASRNTSGIVLKGIAIIITTTIQIISVTILQALGHDDVHILAPHILKDVRSTYRALNIEPTIIRTVCCPKCFTLYPLGANPPDHCNWKASPIGRGKPCGEPLKTRRRTTNGEKTVPRRLYSTQCFDSWLQFFLQRPGTEELVNKSYFPPPAYPDGKVRNTWASRAWRMLTGFPQQPGNLTFSLYVDWFNPYTNKIAGKVVSCGVILLCCMNLPPDIRYLPENVFIVGIIPGPIAPDVITISHILRPLVDALIPYWNGVVVQTHLHPTGTRIRVAVFPFIADLAGARAVSGFLSHSAKLFCSWCLCPSNDKECLDVNKWPLRSPAEVRAQVGQWKEARTTTKRKELAKDNGVRWTALHDLPYFNAVWHIVLGYMHNTLEGVLQDHTRGVYGIGRKAWKEQKEKEEQPADSAVELDSELESLGRKSENSGRSGSESSTSVSSRKRSQRSSASVSSRKRSQQSSASLSSRKRSQQSLLSQQNLVSTPNVYPSPFHLASDEDRSTERQHSTTPRPEDLGLSIPDDEDGSESYTYTGSGHLDDFKPEWLAGIRDCIQNAILPAHTNRPPGNLGESSHGKLTAKQWQELYSIFFPLILPEIWSRGSATDYEQALLINLYHLVASTNIIAAYATSDAEADAYHHHYTQYRITRAQIYGIGSKPNHHYAMHNAHLLKLWGPLSLISEFPGEKMNGMLQQTKKNRRMYDMDFTMLRQMCRRGRFNALVSDGQIQNSQMKALTDLISPTGKNAADTNFKDTTTAEIGELRKKSQEISQEDYTLLFGYLSQHTGLHWRHVDSYPYPLNARVLPTTITTLTHFQHRGDTYSTATAHSGNSAIQFYDYSPERDTVYTGTIMTIWQIPIETQNKLQLRIFLQVAVDKSLSTEEEERLPFHKYPRFNVRVVDGEPSEELVVIEPPHVISHTVIYPRAAGAYGIGRKTKAVCLSLNRGRY